MEGRGDEVDVAPHVDLTPVVPPVVVSAPPASGGSSVRRTVTAFGAGAVVASLVVVGVIARMGESDGPPTSAVAPVVNEPSPSLAPPAVVSPSPPAASPKPSKRVVAPKATPVQKKAAAKPKAKGGSNPAPAKTTPKPATRTPAVPPRRFAWAPVEGAVGYRVELFRGNEQVLKRDDQASRVRTRRPVAASGTHRTAHRGVVSLVRLAGAPERPGSPGGRPGPPRRAVARLLRLAPTRSGRT